MAGWTADEDAKLRQLHADGWTPVRMQEHFPDRTKNGIISRLNRLGLRTREAYIYDRTRNETHELIIRLRCDPWRWDAASIAQALGEKPGFVYNIIHHQTVAA